MNWERVHQEMHVMEWLVDFLHLKDHPELAVIIVKDIDKRGSLAKSMDFALEALSRAIADQLDEEYEDDE